MSGTLTDGTAGLWQIKKRGGIVIVQEPSEAEFPGMPLSAIQNTTVDHVLRTQKIADKLIELVGHHSGLEGVAEHPSILIVEDEALVARNLRERLNELCYKVCDCVKSGEEAIAAANEKNPDFKHARDDVKIFVNAVVNLFEQRVPLGNP